MLLWKNLHSEALTSRTSGQLPVSGVCCLSHPDWEGLTFLFRLPDLPFAFRLIEALAGVCTFYFLHRVGSPLLWDPAVVGSNY